MHVDGSNRAVSTEENKRREQMGTAQTDLDLLSHQIGVCVCAY